MSDKGDSSPVEEKAPEAPAAEDAAKDAEKTNGVPAPPPARQLSSKVFLRQLPADADFEELKKLVETVAPVVSLEQSGSPDHPTAIVTMEAPEGATLVINRLNNHSFQDANIRATIYMERRGGGERGGGRRPRGDMGGLGGGGGRGSGADMPLRMVVDARFVGAIIGQGGANIREITRESKARCVVDVARGIRDQNGAMEKVINIYGQPDNSSKAAIRILAVVQKELAKEAGGKEEEDGQPELKLRAHNQLVGRLIGKGGSTIKKIMEDSATTIFVSNDASGALARDMGVSMERTITIRGSLDAIAAAEEKISAKLRQCWENDMLNATHMAYAGPHPLIPPQDLHSFAGMYAGAAGVGAAGAPAFLGRGGPAVPPLVESVHLYVPNAMVGALIGTKGVHIRNVMRITGAQIRIEAGAGGPGGQAPPPPPKAEEKKENGAAAAAGPNGGANGGPNGAPAADERLVFINGTQEQQYKAQFWIYQRVCEQGFVYFDEVRLVTEVAVPTRLVGRIIGKSGQNVRELQRMTGATVKIPETGGDEEEETIVRITANFNAAQAVQARLRQLVTQFHLQPQGIPPPGPPALHAH